MSFRSGSLEDLAEVSGRTAGSDYGPDASSGVDIPRLSGGSGIDDVRSQAHAPGGGPEEASFIVIDAGDTEDSPASSTRDSTPTDSARYSGYLLVGGHEESAVTDTTDSAGGGSELPPDRPVLHGEGDDHEADNGETIGNDDTSEHPRLEVPQLTFMAEEFKSGPNGKAQFYGESANVTASVRVMEDRRLYSQHAEQLHVPGRRVETSLSVFDDNGQLLVRSTNTYEFPYASAHPGLLDYANGDNAEVAQRLAIEDLDAISRRMTREDQGEAQTGADTKTTVRMPEVEQYGKLLDRELAGDLQPDSDEARLVGRAVDLLGTRYRRVFEQRDTLRESDLSGRQMNEAIAEVLDTKPSQVAIYLARGRLEFGALAADLHNNRLDLADFAARHPKTRGATLALVRLGEPIDPDASIEAVRRQARAAIQARGPTCTDRDARLRLSEESIAAMYLLYGLSDDDTPAGRSPLTTAETAALANRSQGTIVAWEEMMFGKAVPSRLHPGREQRRSDDTPTDD